MPWVPLVPILSALASIYLMFNLKGETWLRFVVWMVLGSVRGSGGLQSSKPGVLDPDDPRSRKADRLQGPS